MRRFRLYPKHSLYASPLGGDYYEGNETAPGSYIIMVDTMVYNGRPAEGEFFYSHPLDLSAYLNRPYGEVVQVHPGLDM